VKPLSIILIFLLCELEAVYEGLEFRGQKTIAKSVQVIWLLDAFFIWKFVEFNWWLVLIYVLLRITLFGITFNLSAGLKWNFIGTTSWYDRYLAKYFMLAPIWWGAIYGLIISILKYKDER